MRINKQLIKLVYNDVKNLAYSLMCYNGVQSVSSMEDPKRLSLRDNHIWLIFLQVHINCSLQINKQLIKLVYNEEKNLA